MRVIRLTYSNFVSHTNAYASSRSIDSLVSEFVNRDELWVLVRVKSIDVTRSVKKIVFPKEKALAVWRDIC